MSTISGTAADTNLVNAILRHGIETPDRCAIIDAGGEGRSVSYGELRRGILLRAGFFLGRGLRPGQIAVLNSEAGDQLDDLLAFLALTAIGVGVYASSMASAVERQVVERLGTNHLVVFASVENAPGNTIAVPSNEDFRQMSDHDGSAVAEAPGLPWLVRSTSGTTGDAKIFITTHEQAAFRRERYYCASGLSNNSIFATFVSLRFGAARQRVFYALSQGASVLILPENGPIETLVEIVRNRQVTHAYCVPLHLTQLCRMAQQSGATSASAQLLGHLSNLESSSSVVTPELRRSVRSLVSPNFSNSYSVSEVGHISTSRLGNQDEDAELCNVGAPVDGVEISILDEQFRRLPAGAKGSIAVRFTSRPMQVAYLNARQEWVSEVRSGYFLPGDLGYLSPSGNLIFECRADDMMIFEGVNIYPREIEAVLERHPDVVEAAAFPVPSAEHGTIPVAAVTLRSALAESTDLGAYCRLQLGSRAPQLIVVVNVLPRNPFGKVLKRQLAAMFRRS